MYKNRGVWRVAILQTRQAGGQRAPLGPDYSESLYRRRRRRGHHHAAASVHKNRGVWLVAILQAPGGGRQSRYRGRQQALIILNPFRGSGRKRHQAASAVYTNRGVWRIIEVLPYNRGVRRVAVYIYIYIYTSGSVESNKPKLRTNPKFEQI